MLNAVHDDDHMQADLEDGPSFLAPIKGCRYVIHTASPVVMNPPKGKVREPALSATPCIAFFKTLPICVFAHFFALWSPPINMFLNILLACTQEYKTVIGPAIKGVENVLSAVEQTPSVDRVVMTSSVGAVVGDHYERGPNHVFTEADWNQTATETFLPYHRQAFMMHQPPARPDCQAVCPLAYRLPAVYLSACLVVHGMEAGGYHRHLIPLKLTPDIGEAGTAHAEVRSLRRREPMSSAGSRGDGRS
jgi:hypothetical protein